MDIFEYADSIDFNADYLDNHTGYIYLLQEAKASGNLNNIRVKDSMTGNIIGEVTRF